MKNVNRNAAKKLDCRMMVKKRPFRKIKRPTMAGKNEMAIAPSDINLVLTLESVGQWQ